MSAPLPVLTSSRSRRPLWIGISVLIMVLLVLSAAFYLVSRGVKMAEGWTRVAETLPDEQLEAIEAGLPLEPEDLRPSPAIRKEKNAAPIYRQLDALYHKDAEKKRSAEGDTLSQFMKPETRNKKRKETQEILRYREKMLKLAEKAADLPSCAFDRKWQQGFDLDFAELPFMRHLARLFAARAILNMEAGNPEAALRDVAFGAKVGVHAGQEPCMIPFLVRIAMHAIMHRPFVEIIQKYGDNLEVLRLAEKTQLAFGTTPDLRDSYRAEIVMGLIQLETYRDPAVPTPSGLSQANFPLVTKEFRAILVDAWESRLLAYWRQVDSEVKASHGNLRNGQIAWQKIIAQEHESAELPGYEFNALLVPVFEKLPSKAMIIEANYQVRNQMIALLEYRIKTRRFPENLDSLPKEKRYSDPYNNKPLIYRKNQKGFLVYSVSENGKDDGGSEVRGKDKYLMDIVGKYP